MIVSINQPAYLPWLGYFERIARSDLHIVLDHVQFEKNSFTNRNKIRTRESWTWLTIPVLTKGKFGDLSICNLELNPAVNWQKKHWRSLEQTYGKSPHFANYRSALAAIYEQKWTAFMPFCRALTEWQLEALGIDTTIRYSSDMTARSAKSQLVLDLCLEAEATTYISGALGRDYLDESLFAAHNIEVVYQEYSHPSYEQVFAGSFEPYMACIDLIFQAGPDALSILMTSGNEERTTP